MGKGGYIENEFTEREQRTGAFHHALDEFFEKWHKKVWEFCDSNQKQAAFYVWTRYWSAIRTLHHLIDAKDYYDCLVISRCCLEINAYLEAICKYPELADDYLYFRKHGKQRYLRLLESEGKKDIVEIGKKNLVELFGEDYDTDKPWKSWLQKFCNGDFRTLLKKLGREDEYSTYNALSHFIHATIIGIELNVKNINMAQKLDENLMGFMLKSYFFLKIVWEQKIIIPEGEKCLKELENLMVVFPNYSDNI